MYSGSKMASLQISIRRDLYNKLKQLKHANESFSDVIERLLPPESNIPQVLACYGIAAKNNDSEILAAYNEAQQIIRKNFHARNANLDTI